MEFAVPMWLCVVIYVRVCVCVCVGTFTCHHVKKTQLMSRLLSSKSSRDQLEGARRACAAALTGDESQYRLYFPCVVKSVGARSPDVRRLVYLFLSVAAERSANDALLCVNALKTELDGGSALGRGMALRALSSLRVPVIRPLVVLAARRGAGDVDVYVRRCAAMAAVKLASDAEEPEPELMDLLRVLLEDAASPVVGTAVVAFNAICPDNWEIIHPVYRKLCKALVDMDAWTQIATLSMLLRYARKHFAKPVDRDDAVVAPGNQDATTAAPVTVTRARFTSIDDFYADEDDDDGDDNDGGAKLAGAWNGDSVSPPPPTDQGQTEAEEGEDENQQEKSEHSVRGEPMQEDHILLIRCARLILNSSNPGVVMAVASLMYHAAPASEWTSVVRALVLAMRLSPHAAPMILGAIVKWAQESPEMFKPFVRFFLVRASDDRGVRALKLEVLTLIADESNTANLLKEFQSYLRDSDKGFVADAVVALGHCAARLPSMSMPCMRALLRLSCYTHSLIADKSMMVMRVLAQSSPQVHAKGIAKVLRKIGRVKSSSARAEAVWMIGGLLPPPGHAVSGKAEKLLGTLETAAQRALFSSAKNFATEKDVTKVQMLCASARLFVRNPTKMGLLHKYLIEVARCGRRATHAWRRKRNHNNDDVYSDNTESQRLAYERSLLTNDGIYVILILIRVNVRLCVYVHVRFAYVCPPDSFVLFADMT